MGKHRQKKHYRRIVVAAVALGVVGVPSVSMACGDWQGTGDHRFHGADRKNVAAHWWHTSDWTPPAAGARRTPAPSSTATPGTARPSAPAAPRTPAAPSKPAAPSTKAAPSKPKATATASAPAAAPSTPKPATTASAVTARIVQLVNAERAKAGCSPLTLNPVLTRAAQAHSADMAAHGTMSHTGSDGSSPGDRLTRAGYLWSAYGENVAYGYATAEQVMAGWMASPGHRANILTCSFKEIGVGFAQPGSYWTQDFGTPR